MKQDFHKQHMELTANQICFLLLSEKVKLILPILGKVSHLHEIFLEQTIRYFYEVFPFFSLPHSSIFLLKHYIYGYILALI